MRLQAEARAEREEFEAIVKKQITDAEAERSIEVNRGIKYNKYAVDLKVMIEDNSLKSRNDRNMYLDEGRKQRSMIAEEKAKLERIKQDKLSGLEKLEIPEKYLAELARKKVHN